MTHINPQNTLNGSTPKSVIEELNLNAWMSQIGEQHYNLSQASKRKEKKCELIPKTDAEIFSKQKKQLYATFHSKGNMLTNTGRIKIFLFYLIAFLTTLIDFFIYRNIAENVLYMPIIETYLVAFLSLVFTKVIQIVFQEHIKTFLKENSSKLRSFIKILLYSLVTLILINAVMSGITNTYNIDRQKEIEQIELLSEQVEQSEGENRISLEAELQKAQNDLASEDNTFLLIARFFAVALLGLLSIICASVCWSVADLCNYALKLRKRRQMLKDELTLLRANFQSYIQTFEEMVSLQKDLIITYGQKAFLERLMSNEQEKALEMTDNTKS